MYFLQVKHSRSAKEWGKLEGEEKIEKIMKMRSGKLVGNNKIYILFSRTVHILSIARQFFAMYISQCSTVFFIHYCKKEKVPI